MLVPKDVVLKKAEYVGSYKFLFTWSNGHKHITDFKQIITKHKSLNKFLDIDKFKKIKFDSTSLIYWGKNYDMSFEKDIYYNELKIK